MWWITLIPVLSNVTMKKSWMKVFTGETENFSVNLPLRVEVQVTGASRITWFGRHQNQYTAVCQVSLHIAHRYTDLPCTKNTKLTKHCSHVAVTLNIREGIRCMPAVWGLKRVVSGLPRAPVCYYSTPVWDCQEGNLLANLHALSPICYLLLQPFS